MRDIYVEEKTRNLVTESCCDKIMELNVAADSHKGLIVSLCCKTCKSNKVVFVYAETDEGFFANPLELAEIGIKQLQETDPNIHNPKCGAIA